MPKHRCFDTAHSTALYILYNMLCVPVHRKREKESKMKQKMEIIANHMIEWVGCQKSRHSFPFITWKIIINNSNKKREFYYLWAFVIYLRWHTHISMGPRINNQAKNDSKKKIELNWNVQHVGCVCIHKTESLKKQFFIFFLFFCISTLFPLSVSIFLKKQHIPLFSAK